MATMAKALTGEELLTIPDDGVERWILDGELRERDSESKELGTTVRNRFHSHTMANVVLELGAWRRKMTPPRGQVLCGEAGVRLRGCEELSPQRTQRAQRKKRQRNRPLWASRRSSCLPLCSLCSLW